MQFVSTNIMKAPKYSLQSSDQDLVQGCLQDHRLAQKYLYQRYFGKMLGICMRYSNSREAAIAILNGAFHKVFDSLPNYKDQGTLSGWIARIVYRVTIDYVRANTSYKKIMDFNSEEDAPVENKALSNLAAAELYALIQQLPAATRTVFSMYVVEGFKHAEVAQELGISTGTSKWHLAQARKTLQLLLQQQNQV